jgi:hypothetical protein
MSPAGLKDTRHDYNDQVLAKLRSALVLTPRQPETTQGISCPSTQECVVVGSETPGDGLRQERSSPLMMAGSADVADATGDYAIAPGNLLSQRDGLRGGGRWDSSARWPRPGHDRHNNRWRKRLGSSLSAKWGQRTQQYFMSDLLTAASPSGPARQVRWWRTRRIKEPPGAPLRPELLAACT